MKQKKRIKKIGISICILLIGMLSLIGGYTYSKYQSEVTGKGIAQIAKWEFKVNEQSSKMEHILLKSTNREGIMYNEKLAPGTKGDFTLTFDASNAVTNVDYKVEFLNETVNKPENLIFKYEGFTVSSIKELEKYLTGLLSSKAGNAIQTATIEWEWKYQTGNTVEEIAENDRKDTQTGLALEQYGFDIVVTGTQSDPML